MAEPETETPILPAHIDETVQAIARLHADHLREAGALQRLVESMTAWIGRPVILAALSMLITAWIVGNLAARHMGMAPWDAPPFAWLQDALSLCALYVTVLILTTQRREDQLSVYREQLSLELAILGEQKSAKIIALLEEMRADHPEMRNRTDAEADALAVAANPDAMLSAIRERQDSPPARDLSQDLAKQPPDLPPVPPGRPGGA